MGGRFPSGATLILFETLDSTNSEARRRADEGARGPAWIVALEQTAGYGRRGAAWTQGAGDIAATLLFEPKAPVERLGELSFAAGLAVAETIAHYAPRADISLKWPNDVLLGGGKIAGLLLELMNARGGEPLLAFGAGVNIVSKPGGADYQTARLIDHLGGEAPPQPQAFVEVLDAAFNAWLALWRKEGFQPIRSAWLEKAARLGEKIQVRLPSETLEGVFRDLDQSGALILDCEGERRLISAGAVFPALSAPRSGV